MLSGILFQLFYGLMGSWTAYLISILYVEYRTRKEREKADFRNHVIQVLISTTPHFFSPTTVPSFWSISHMGFSHFHVFSCQKWFEVLDGLLGKHWRNVGLAFNCTFLLFGSVIQLIACARHLPLSLPILLLLLLSLSLSLSLSLVFSSPTTFFFSFLYNKQRSEAFSATGHVVCCSNIYYINDNLDKRTWTYIFGACCATTVFIPSFHNYRIWSFLGLIMTTYTAWYLTVASLLHGQVLYIYLIQPNIQNIWY